MSSHVAEARLAGEAHRPRIRACWTYALTGVLLSLGAPLGALAIRILGGVSDIPAELSEHRFFYQYELIGSSLVFGLAGWLVGRRADRYRDGRDLYRDLAEHDDLTALANARAFAAHQRRAAEHSARYREPLSLLLLDVDQLKAINDTLGHKAGGAALVRVAEVLNECKREDDLAARLGRRRVRPAHVRGRCRRGAAAGRVDRRAPPNAPPPRRDQRTPDLGYDRHLHVGGGQCARSLRPRRSRALCRQSGRTELCRERRRLIPKPPFARDLSRGVEIAEFERLKPRLRDLWSALSAREEEPYTSVVVPSLTLDQSELAKLDGAAFYEERLLFLLIRLRNPQARMVYVTSQPIHPLILEYYFQLLAGIPASHARARLTLLCAHDASPRSLTEKILERPRLIQRIRYGIADPSRAFLTVFNSTPLERKLAVLLGHPAERRRPAALAASARSREAARCFGRPGVSLPEGFEDLRSRGRRGGRRSTSCAARRPRHLDARSSSSTTASPGKATRSSAIPTVARTRGPPRRSARASTFAVPTETPSVYSRQVRRDGRDRRGVPRATPSRPRRACSCGSIPRARSC